MDYRTLGRSNLKVSRLWLGGMSFGDPRQRAWVQDAPVSEAIIRRALDLGINVIDTCDAYTAGVSEEIIGRTVDSLGVRDQLVIATKLGLQIGPDRVNGSGYSRKHIVSACEASLRRLRTDYIDLYQTHIWRPATDIDEMLEAFDRLVRDGKVLYAGATDMPAWQFAKSVYTARHRGLSPFVSMQHHYNAIWREDERELMPFCRAEGIGIVAYSPLGRGFLCDPDRPTRRRETDDMVQRWYNRPADRAVAAAVAAVAAERGTAPAAVALGWVLSTPGVTAAVVGPTRPEQLDLLVEAVGLDLPRSGMPQIEQAYAYRASSGHH